MTEICVILFFHVFIIIFDIDASVRNIYNQDKCEQVCG